MNLKNKIAVVTGGSSGIGQAICVALAKEGVEVIFTYNKSDDGAEKTLKEIEGKGEKYKVDIEIKDAVSGFSAFIKDKYKNIDILVNCAGIEVLGEQLDLNLWRKTFETDLFAVVSVTNSFLKIFNERGKILNISSLYGDEHYGNKDAIAYSAAKSALNSFTRTLAKTIAPNILVNAIEPGYVKTPMWSNTSEDEFEKLSKDKLIERIIDPTEIAQMAVAILKNDAMTSEIVVVDGGLSLKTV